MDKQVKNPIRLTVSQPGGAGRRVQMGTLFVY